MPSIKEKELIDQACKNLSDKLGGCKVKSAMSQNRILDSTISVADGKAIIINNQFINKFKP